MHPIDSAEPYLHATTLVSEHLTRDSIRDLSLLCVALVTMVLPSVLRAQDPTGVIKKNTREETFELESLGTVHALVPTAEINSVVLFLSGDGGWNGGVNDMAQLLANEGALVAGVDVVPYLKALNKGGSACAAVADDVATLNRTIRSRYRVDANSTPIIVGYSSGATLAFAIAAQAPTQSIRGFLTLGFCDTLEVQRPLCTGRRLAFYRKTEGLAFLPTHVDVPWRVLQGAVDRACTIDEVQPFADAVPDARVIPLPKVGHGFAVARRWQPQYVAAYKQLAEK